MPSKKARRKARERALVEVPLDTPDDFEMIEPYPPPRLVCDACVQTDPPTPPASPLVIAARAAVARADRTPAPSAKEAAALAPSCVIA